MRESAAPHAARDRAQLEATRRTVGVLVSRRMPRRMRRRIARTSAMRLLAMLS
jgi:hypothetical protein